MQQGISAVCRGRLQARSQTRARRLRTRDAETSPSKFTLPRQWRTTNHQWLGRNNLFFDVVPPRDVSDGTIYLEDHQPPTHISTNNKDIRVGRPPLESLRHERRGVLNGSTPRIQWPGLRENPRPKSSLSPVQVSLRSSPRLIRDPISAQ